MGDGLVILGGSYAACEIAQAARANGFDGAIRILTDEADYPYHRPPLSKAFLLDGGGEGALPLKGEKFYTDQRIDVIFGKTAIDMRNGAVAMQDGSAVRFDKLALAVGARARRLQIPGADLEGIVYLRSLADARALKIALALAQQVVVIGGGFIGLEVASAAVQLGKSVTVLEAQPDLLMRVVAQPVARFLHEQHEKNGVSIRTGAKVAEIRGDKGRVRQVVLDDGTAFDADLVVVGIGSVPNSELAATAGLQCRDGIVVDRFGQTSDPRIWAAGDCTFYPGPYTRDGMRLESVQNAMDQGRSAGASIAGKQKAYDAIPWFWSDQYKFKLQITGISKGHTSFVERGDADTMSVFYFKDEACIAVDSINRPRDHMASRRVLPAGATRDQLEDANYDLSALMPGRSRAEARPTQSTAAG
jgi:3-phenylpropionate/trans-cinnamate dioxygenase ferredoxin reductase subunit